MKITLTVPIRPSGFSDVEAEFLWDLAPHLAKVATFALNAAPWEYRTWVVTNVETGLSVSHSWLSKKDAIRLAKERLAKQTCASINLAYKKVGAA